MKCSYFLVPLMVKGRDSNCSFGTCFVSEKCKNVLADISWRMTIFARSAAGGACRESRGLKYGEPVALRRGESPTLSDACERAPGMAARTRMQARHAIRITMIRTGRSPALSRLEMVCPDMELICDFKG